MYNSYTRHDLDEFTRLKSQADWLAAYVTSCRTRNTGDSVFSQLLSTLRSHSSEPLEPLEFVMYDWLVFAKETSSLY